MIRSVLPILACLSIFILGSCKPGDYCGRESMLDCDYNCMHSMEYLEIRGDGVCDEKLNCSTFEYDGGDCEGGG